jgi:hypothetical protein
VRKKGVYWVARIEIVQSQPARANQLLDILKAPMRIAFLCNLCMRIRTHFLSVIVAEGVTRAGVEDDEIFGQTLGQLGALWRIKEETHSDRGELLQFRRLHENEQHET